MIGSIQDSIKKLKQYNNVNYPILSVYLTVPPDSSKDCEIMLKTFQKLVKKSLNRRERNKTVDDVDYIGAYLQQYRNTHMYKGLAIYSGGNKLWEVVNTKFTFTNAVYYGNSPYLIPLLEDLEEHKRFLVILADREKARMFTILNGEVEAETTIQDPSVPQNVKANEEHFYGRSDKISRHIQDHLHRHLKFISEKILQFTEHKPISGVIVGGHNTLIHKTEEYLPDPLRKKVIAEFISELNTSLTDLASKSLSIINSMKGDYYSRTSF